MRRSRLYLPVEIESCRIWRLGLGEEVEIKIVVDETEERGKDEGQFRANNEC
jgi:hypothetical protein